MDNRQSSNGNSYRDNNPDFNRDISLGQRLNAQQIGQGLFPAPKQMDHIENGNPNSFSVNRPDGIRFRGVDTENRKAEVKLDDMATMGNRRNDRSFLSGDSGNTPDGGMTNEQNTATNFDSGRNPVDPGNRDNPGSSNRADDEVKAQSVRLSAPAKLAAFDNVQPDTQKSKKQRRASGSTKTLKGRKRNTLTPPTIPGHKWKPSGKTGWELYTREASISENGKRSSTGKYIAYYSLEAIKEENAKRKKKAKFRRTKKQS